MKKGDYDTAVKYFDEALGMETDNAKKSEMAYATAAALWQAKKLSQARTYAQKAISFNETMANPIFCWLKCTVQIPTGVMSLH